MTGIYIYHFIKKAAGMKTGHIRIGIDLRIADLLFGQKFLIAKRVFDLIPIIALLRSTLDRKQIGQCYFTNALQGIEHLLLFILQLLFVGQHLPLTSTADAEMLAKRRYPIGRIAVKFYGTAFSPILFT